MSTLVELCLTLVIIGCFQSSLVSARQINITYLENCKDVDSHTATAYLREVDYHITEDGTCDIVHCKVEFTTLDTEPYALVMSLFKCPEAFMKTSCLDNPTIHEELLDCERLMNDDSGPWHMFSSALDGGQCGDQIGMFEMNFARLRLEHLIKYLDVYDANFNTFRLKMNFKSTLTGQVRGCADLDFTLS